MNDSSRQSALERPPAPAHANSLPPPRALRRPHELVEHGHRRVDPYYWLRDDDREDAQVLAHLRAENAYTDAMLAPVQALQQRLYDELVARVLQDDESVPYEQNGYWYSSRYRKGLEHPIYLRRQGAPDGPEEIILDINELAQDHDFYEVGNLDVSPDGRWLAYVEDPVSRGEWTLKIKDLHSGETLDPGVTQISTSLAWADDNRTLFYVRQQADTMIPYQVWRQHRDEPADRAVRVYEESDPSFWISVDRSRCERHIFISAHQTLSSEIQVLSAQNPDAPPRMCLPRERLHEYSVDTLGERVWICSNWQAENFRLFEATLDTMNERANWREIVPHRDDVLLNDFAVFRNHLVLEERQEGLLRLRVLPLSGAEELLIAGDEEAGTYEIDVNPSVDSDVLRISYTSMTTPECIYEYDMHNGERRLLKQTQVPGGYRPEDYATERFYAPARDGRRIPVTLLYRRGMRPDGSHPLWIQAYGAYGIVLDPEFRTSRLPLIDRGVVFAIAHVRGGEDLGRQWYEQGRLFHKLNTFHDFIDVTEHLHSLGWGAPERTVASGGSAGGLLIGAVLNLRADLYHAAIANVPFVDVVTTMLDESIPLTTFEYDQWGDPRDPQYYRYILSYSPYDNVQAQEYPHLYVSTGLWDPAVQYWEPAKWVAKLRVTATGNQRLLLHTDLQAGHRGQAGRFQRLHEVAREYAFVCDVLGIQE